MSSGPAPGNRILLADDSPVYRRMISGLLVQWGFEPVVVGDGLQAWTLLQSTNSPRLALIDWVMPQMDGPELCRKIRERGADSYTYVVLLTAKDGRGDLLKGLEAGADDYLNKPFDEPELKARLMVGRRILELQHDLIVTREAMRHSATHDSLTGLVNRKEILDILHRELARATRERLKVSIAIVDIDRFKNINDEFGHLFGDEALKEVARRLRSSVRIYDSVGRYGGEEFLMIFPGCDLTDVLIRAEEVLKNVSATPIKKAGRQRQVTISMGVAVWECTNASEPEALLSHADAGLYQAKKSGRNRVEHLDHKNHSHRVNTALGRG